MLKRILSFPICCVLAACSGPAELSLPDGAVRTPVNSQQAIADYNAAAARSTASSRASIQVASETELIKAELANLREILTQADLERRPPASTALRPASAMKGATFTAAPRNELTSPIGLRASESIRYTTTAIQFRVTFAEDDATFSPSQAFRQALLRAAGSSRAVSILGASDSAITTAKSETAAATRAENVGTFLIANGIDPAKLKTASVPSGAFIADNSTIAGKSMNRRVDIQITRSQPIPASPQ